jgi:hypothetical protein
MSLSQHAARHALVLVDHRDRAGQVGRDERHRRDARRGDGEVSCGVGSGEAKRITPA